MSTHVWSPPYQPIHKPEPLPDGPDPGLLLDIWFTPRPAMRTVLDHGRTYGVLFLAALSGLASFKLSGSADVLTTPQAYYMFGGLFLAAPLFGILGIYLEALVIWMSATVFGLAADVQSIAAAGAWGRVPSTVCKLIALPFAVAAFLGASLQPLLFVVVVLTAIGWFWSWITHMSALGEALEIHAARAFLVYVAPGFGLTVGILAIFVLGATLS